MSAPKARRQIDLKHHVESDGKTIEIVKSPNGQPIPEDEPLMLFRGRDYLAVPMIELYRDLCANDGANDFQLAQVDGLLEKFKAWAAANGDKMKQPGITRGK